MEGGDICHCCYSCAHSDVWVWEILLGCDTMSHLMGVSNNAGGKRSALLARDSIGIECHARE